MRNYFERRAFTLAEVMLVLSVIGIISALTIPGVVQNLNDKQGIVSWKKAFSDLSQAQKMAMIDNDGSFLSICPTNDHNCLRDKIVVNLKPLKLCNAPLTAGNCWHNVEVPNSFGQVLGDDSGAILSNGSYVSFDMDDSSCKFNDGLGTICGKISIDINGPKPPNIGGKDIFGAYILQDRLVPAGVPGNSFQCVNGNGVGCSYSKLVNN